MRNTSKLTPEGVNGLQKRKHLPPWEIAVKLFRTVSGKVVDVEHASDTEFQEWISSQGIPVDEDGIVEWSFEDRCGVINHVLQAGKTLRFDECNTSAKRSVAEVFDVSESAPGAS